MNRLLKIALSAGAATMLVGGAWAQGQAPGSPGTGAGSGAEQPSQSMPSERSSGATQPGSAERGAPSGSAAMQQPSPDWVGKDVVNAEGETIGEVEEVMGDRAIVSVGGFLGIGAKQVELSADQIRASGSGEDLTLTTNMTRDELESLPEYQEQGETGPGGATSPGGSPGTTR